MDRIVYSYQCILLFFGWRLHDAERGEIDRHRSWRERYDELGDDQGRSAYGCISWVLRCMLELTMPRMAVRFMEELRRHYSVTPKNYLDFISNYKDQLARNERKADQSVKRLEGGLTKLVEAAGAVDRMQVDLSEKKVVVDAKTEDVTKLIENISEKKKIADQQQAEAEVKQIEAEEQAPILERLVTSSNEFSIYVVARKPLANEENQILQFQSLREREEYERTGLHLVRVVRRVVWRRATDSGGSLVPLMPWEVLDHAPLQVLDYPEDL